MTRLRALLGAASVVSMAACAGGPTVERGYDADLVHGRYIEPEAYAWFLRGSIADASAQRQVAVAAFREVELIDPDADEARSKSLEAQCAPRRCPENAPEAAAAQPSDRQVLVARTLTSADPMSALLALESWAEAKGDASLRDEALRELARVAPEKRDWIGHVAERLAGAGEMGSARAVAGAAVDASDAPWHEGASLAPLLAIDEAIAREDMSALIARAVRTRVTMEDAAGRALLMKHASVARDLAMELTRASPNAFAPRAIAAMCGHHDLLGLLLRSAKPDEPLAISTWVSLGQELGHVGAVASARGTLGALPHAPVVPGDDGVERPMTALALRGLVDRESLPPDVRVELRALGKADAPHPEPAISPTLLDARHQCLALATDEPKSDRSREMSLRLRSAAPRDPVVALCHALVAVARGEMSESAASEALIVGDPGDPLLAAAAFSLARDAGDAEGERQAQRVFAWVSSSPDP